MALGDRAGKGVASADPRGPGRPARARALRIVSLVLAAARLAGASVLLLAVQRQPAAAPPATPAGVDGAPRVGALARRTRAALRHADRPVRLPVSEAELDSLLAFAPRGLDRFTARTSFSRDEIGLAAPYRLGPHRLGGFLNLRIGIGPPEQGLGLSRLSVGRLRLPGALALGFQAVFRDVESAEYRDLVAVNGRLHPPTDRVRGGN